MNTLERQKVRLQREIDEAYESAKRIRASGLPDMNTLKQIAEQIERNQQLISMIDGHLLCDHQPMWRRK